MELNTATGWIDGIKQRKSPYCNPRPAQEKISLIVIHNISLPPGEFDQPYIDQMFMGELDQSAHPYFATINTQVSAHFLITRPGVITQYVSINERAWHAGESQYKGRERCNDFSIGIELEGTDEQEFTQEQYQSLIFLIKELLKKIPTLSVDNITGHSDIAPGRKTDPGPCFNWDYFLNEIKQTS